MAELTAKQQRFVEEYLVDLNATQAAARRAGYSKKTAYSMRKLTPEPMTHPSFAEQLRVWRRIGELNRGENMTCKRVGCDNQASFLNTEFHYCSLNCLDTDVHRILESCHQDAQALCVDTNRRSWLALMRSGQIKKGVTKFDGAGEPVNPEGGFCAAALMYTMFTFPGDGQKAYWKRMGIGQKEVQRLGDLNSSSMTFPEIADIVAAEFGWEGSCARDI